MIFSHYVWVPVPITQPGQSVLHSAAASFSGDDIDFYLPINFQTKITCSFKLSGMTNPSAFNVASFTNAFVLSACSIGNS